MTQELTSTEAVDETAVSPEIDTYLRADRVNAAINDAAAGEGLPPIPKNYVFRKRDRESVSVAVRAAFELIGSVPAMAQWAANNPDKFYPLYSRFAQSDTLTPGGNNTQIVFQSSVPVSPLDLVNRAADGRVYRIDDFDDDGGDIPE